MERDAAPSSVQDFDQLERDLERRKVFVGLNALLVVVVLGILALGYAFHYPFWVVMLLPIVAVIFLAIVRIGVRSWHAHSDAWDTLQEIVHEEWRSGKQTLPGDFPVGRWYSLFRTPPPLTERELRGLRRVEWVKGKQGTVVWAVWGTTMMFAILGSLVGIAYFGIPSWWPMVAFIGLLPPFTVGWFWALKDSDLLYHLREYERVTGTTVLPPDLGKPDPRKASP